MRRALRCFPALLLTAACISERSPSEPVQAAECRLPVQNVARGDAIVLIRGQRFLPDTVRIRSGQAVTWVNCEAADADPHTTTAQQGAWDSPLLRPGDHYEHTFDAAGGYAYTCVPHPHMRGSVIVE